MRGKYQRRGDEADQSHQEQEVLFDQHHMQGTCRYRLNNNFNQSGEQKISTRNETLNPDNIKFTLERISSKVGRHRHRIDSH